MALLDDEVRKQVAADMVEATEFPHLAMRYQVQGVPSPVTNEVTHIEGAVPELAMVSRLMAGFGNRLAWARPSPGA
jgi:hypothetical protein